MRTGIKPIILTLAVLSAFAGCGERTRVQQEESTAGAVACDSSAARVTVEQFGNRLKQVSLLAPDTAVVRQIRDAYGDLVTPDLLDLWLTEPALAPGQATSSPWPERIEVRSVAPQSSGACSVEGSIVYMTSAGVYRGGGSVREPIVALVSEREGWRISALEHTEEEVPADTTGVPAAVRAVITDYYAAINARDFRRAYEAWGAAGEATGQSFEEFAAGFENTEQVSVEIGRPGRIEPAAGSRYVEVPVMIRARTTSGDEQQFEGTYTMRQTRVDGATPAQRRWHIYAANVTQN